MLTLVEPQPRKTPVSWSKVMRLLLAGPRVLAAMWRSRAVPAQGAGTAR